MTFEALAGLLVLWFVARAAMFDWAYQNDPEMWALREARRRIRRAL